MWRQHNNIKGVRKQVREKAWTEQDHLILHLCRKIEPSNKKYEQYMPLILKRTYQQINTRQYSSLFRSKTPYLSQTVQQLLNQQNTQNLIDQTKPINVLIYCLKAGEGWDKVCQLLAINQYWDDCDLGDWNEHKFWIYYLISLSGNLSNYSFNIELSKLFRIPPNFINRIEHSLSSRQSTFRTKLTQTVNHKTIDNPIQRELISRTLLKQNYDTIKIELPLTKLIQQAQPWSYRDWIIFLCLQIASNHRKESFYVNSKTKSISIRIVSAKQIQLQSKYNSIFLSKLRKFQQNEKNVTDVYDQLPQLLLGYIFNKTLWNEVIKNIYSSIRKRQVKLPSNTIIDYYQNVQGSDDGERILSSSLYSQPFSKAEEWLLFLVNESYGLDSQIMRKIFKVRKTKQLRKHFVRNEGIISSQNRKILKIFLEDKHLLRTVQSRDEKKMIQMIIRNQEKFGEGDYHHHEQQQHSQWSAEENLIIYLLMQTYGLQGMLVEQILHKSERQVCEYFTANEQSIRMHAQPTQQILQNRTQYYLKFPHNIKHIQNDHVRALMVELSEKWMNSQENIDEQNREQWETQNRKQSKNKITQQKKNQSRNKLKQKSLNFISKIFEQQIKEECQEQSTLIIKQENDIQC